MSAGIYDTTIEQGATFNRVITWETGSTPTPVNLTGYTARMTLKSASLPDVKLTTENSRIALGGSAGTITLFLLATDTDGMAAAAYRYDLELISGANVYRVLQGTMTVSENITT